MNNSPERQALVLKGYSEQKDLHFLLLVGLRRTGSSGPTVSELSAAGAPKSHYFTPVTTQSDPDEIRETIFDVRRTMTQQRKQFYLKEIREQFKQFFESNLGTVLAYLREDEIEDLETFIRDDFYKFNIDELDVARFPYESLQPRKQDEANSGQSETGGSGGSRSSETVEPTTIEIAPEIDVQTGVRVEQLEPGTPIVVRLTERSAKLFGSTFEGKRPRLPGDFVQYKLKSSRAEGTMRVRLQDGLHGVGEVSPGSLIRLYHPDSDATRDTYERQLQPFIWIVVFLIILLTLFAYFVIF